MDKKIKILTIGTHKEICDIVLRLINQDPGWEGHLAMNEQDAKSVFKDQDFDLVLLGSGIEEAMEERLRTFFKNMKPSIIILQHYGGGSGLLKGEIQEALESL